MKSHAIASSQPPPSAKPLTAAMTGFFTLDRSSSSEKDLALEHVHVREVLHGLDVGARDEGLVAAARDDDRAHLGVEVKRRGAVRRAP